MPIHYGLALLRPESAQLLTQKSGSFYTLDRSEKIV